MILGSATGHQAVQVPKADDGVLHQELAVVFISYVTADHHGSPSRVFDETCRFIDVCILLEG